MQPFGKKSLVWILLTLASFFSVSFTNVGLPTATQFTVMQRQTSRCGSSETQYDFGFSYEQRYWAVNWEGFVSEVTAAEMDEVLNTLNEDNIAQTMVFFMKEEQVSVPSNCAAHFLRYMELGNAEGERKDNGFSWLIMVKRTGSIEVHYAVGLGLPALTASGLGPVLRNTEQKYDQTKSLDQAALALSNSFNDYARTEYEPWHPAVTSESQPAVNTPGSAAASFLMILCVVFLIVMALLLLLVVINGSTGGGGYSGGYSGGIGTGSSPSSRGDSRGSGGVTGSISSGSRGTRSGGSRSGGGRSGGRSGRTGRAR